MVHNYSIHANRLNNVLIKIQLTLTVEAVETRDYTQKYINKKSTYKLKLADSRSNKCSLYALMFTLTVLRKWTNILLIFLTLKHSLLPQRSPKYELLVMKTAQTKFYQGSVPELNTEDASEISECALASMRIHYHIDYIYFLSIALSSVNPTYICGCHSRNFAVCGQKTKVVYKFWMDYI